MAIAMEVAGDAKLKGFHVVGMEQPGILHVMFLRAPELNAMVFVPALPPRDIVMDLVFVKMFVGQME